MSQRMEGRAWLLAVVLLLSGSFLLADSLTVEVRQGDSNAFVDDYGGFSGTMLIEKDWQTERYEEEIAFQLVGAESPARRRIILRFDLSFLDRRIEGVTGASLVLYKYLDPTPYDQNFTFSVYQISDDNKGWTTASWLFPESTRRWAGAPGLEAAGLDYEEPALAAGVGFDTTLKQGEEVAKIELPPALIERWIRGENAGLLLVIDEESTTDKNGYFYSSNVKNPGEVRPLLEVRYSKNK